MVELSYMALSLTSYLVLSNIKKHRALTFFVGLVPLLLCYYEMKFFFVSTILCLVGYLPFLLKNKLHILQSETDGLFHLVLLWMTIFLVKLETETMLFLLVLVFSIISFRGKASEKNWLYIVDKYFILFVLAIYAFFKKLQILIDGNSSSLLALLTIFVIFILLGNGKSEKVIENDYKVDPKPFFNIYHYIDHLLIPYATIQYLSLGQSQINLVESINVLILLLLIIMTFYWFISIKHGINKVIYTRVSSFNAFSVIIFSWLTNFSFAEYSFIALFINYILMELIIYLETIEYSKLGKNLLLGLFLSAPFSPIFLYKYILVSRSLTMQSYSAVFVIISLIILPLMLYPFIYSPGDHRE